MQRIIPVGVTEVYHKKIIENTTSEDCERKSV